jgi:hypothetical protein
MRQRRTHVADNPLLCGTTQASLPSRLLIDPSFPLAASLLQLALYEGAYQFFV